MSPPCATRGLGAWHRAAAGRAQMGAHRCSRAVLQHQRTQPGDSLPSIELSHLISRLFVIPFAFGRGQQPVQPDVTERPRSRMSPSTDPFSPPFWGMFLQYPAAEAHPTLPVIFPRVPAPAWPCPRSLKPRGFSSCCNPSPPASEVQRCTVSTPARPGINHGPAAAARQPRSHPPSAAASSQHGPWAGRNALKRTLLP